MNYTKIKYNYIQTNSKYLKLIFKNAHIYFKEGKNKNQFIK